MEFECCVDGGNALETLRQDEEIKQLMGVLHKAYNLSFLQFFRWIYVSNADNVSLKTFLADRVKRFEEEPQTVEFYNELNTDLLDVVPEQTINNEQRVYAKDAKVWNDMKMCGVESGMSELFPGFTAEEQEAVWNKFVGLCKYQAMLRSCGQQTEAMEDLAMQFIQKNQGDIKQEDFYAKVFDEMISGGDMTQKLIQSFSDPSFMKGIIQNFGSMIQAPGQPPIDMSPLAAQITEEKLKELPAQFNNLMTQMKTTGVNPFEALRPSTSQSDEKGQGQFPSVPPVDAAKMVQMMAKLRASKSEEEEVDSEVTSLLSTIQESTQESTQEEPAVQELD